MYLCETYFITFVHLMIKSGHLQKFSFLFQSMINKVILKALAKNVAKEVGLCVLVGFGGAEA